MCDNMTIRAKFFQVAIRTCPSSSIERITANAADVGIREAVVQNEWSIHQSVLSEDYATPASVPDNVEESRRHIELFGQASHHVISLNDSRSGQADLSTT